MLSTSDLDTIKESTALDHSLPEFPKREINSLSWTLQHTTNDGEMLLFLEGIPVYLNSRWSDLHFGKPQTRFDNSPAQVLRAVLHHPESTFLSKLDTFISTQWRSMSERDASAVVNALSSLLEKEVHPYTEATRFLHRGSSSLHLQGFMEQAIELYPSLSPAIRHLRVMAVLCCAEVRGSKYTTTYDDLRCWPYYSVLVPVKSLRYSELHPFWDAITSFSGLRLRNGALASPTAATAATAAEANQGIALLSLCIFCWEAVPDPQGHFTYTFHHVMYDLISYVSPLAEGSAGAQQAYSASVLLITSALEEACSELERRMRMWYWDTERVVSKLLDPLVKITDDAAATTAQRVLCSPLWLTRLPRNIPSSWPENPKVNQTICARQLIESLGVRYRRRLPSIPENVTTLAGLHSTIQIQLTQRLKDGRLTNIPPHDVQHIPSFFRLLGTLDEPNAVMEVQRALREFLITPQTDNNFDAAREALTQLELTASNPGFVLQALSSVPDYPLVAVEENSTLPFGTRRIDDEASCIHASFFDITFKFPAARSSSKTAQHLEYYAKPGTARCTERKIRGKAEARLDEGRLKTPIKRKEKRKDKSKKRPGAEKKRSQVAVSRWLQRRKRMDNVAMRNRKGKGASKVKSFDNRRRKRL
ncbi:hypothetical protein C8J56DRAFT_1174087 [Mycena floridula]|nr:hypothetical protein C8J56DRAFT_1174087 [Mycena floridula]